MNACVRGVCDTLSALAVGRRDILIGVPIGELHDLMYFEFSLCLAFSEVTTNAWEVGLRLFHLVTLVAAGTDGRRH